MFNKDLFQASVIYIKKKKKCKGVDNLSQLKFLKRRQREIFAA